MYANLSVYIYFSHEIDSIVIDWQDLASYFSHEIDSIVIDWQGLASCGKPLIVGL